MTEQEIADMRAARVRAVADAVVAAEAEDKAEASQAAYTAVVQALIAKYGREAFAAIFNDAFL